MPTVVLGAPAREAESPEGLRGPVAVIGLVSQSGADDPVSGFARAIHGELEASGKVEVYNPEMIAGLLTGGGPRVSAKESLDRLQGLFQQGYLQSYSFEYRKALKTFHRVLEGLDRLPPGPARWELWIKVKLFQGISQLGLKNEPAALKCFAAVLRTRPKMKLSRREYSPRTIKRFRKAARRLAAVERGSLAVQTDPPGARVLLDGHPVGTTPYIGQYPHGQYHLQVVHEKTGGAVRWVRVGPEPARVRLQLSFEGALVLDREHPCVRLPPGAGRLPEPWWPWLGDRLGLRLLVAVRVYREGPRPFLSAGLVDLERGRRIREASLELADQSPEKLGENARALADFLVTGKAISTLQVSELGPKTRPDPIGTRVPDLPARYAPRPWTRQWWPYAAGGGFFVACGAGAHLAASHYQRKADQSASVAQQKASQETADSWLIAAITGYALAGATLVTGIILYATHQPKEVFESATLVPLAGPGTVGLSWRVGF